MKIEFSDVIKLIGIFLLSAAIVWIIPANSEPTTTNIFPVMLVYSFLIGFLINRSMDRKQVLDRSIAIELSRLRRIKHISEGFEDANWQKNIIAGLIGYQTEIANNFLSYELARHKFRELTHLIYRFKPIINHESILYGDLLNTLKDVALERQHIEQTIKDRISLYSWLFMCIMTTLLVVLIAIERKSTGVANFAAWAGIAGNFLATDFLYRVNKLSRFEVIGYQKMYKNNVVAMKE